MASEQKKFPRINIFFHSRRTKKIAQNNTIQKNDMKPQLKEALFTIRDILANALARHILVRNASYATTHGPCLTCLQVNSKNSWSHQHVAYSTGICHNFFFCQNPQLMFFRLDKVLNPVGQECSSISMEWDTLLSCPILTVVPIYILYLSPFSSFLFFSTFLSLFFFVFIPLFIYLFIFFFLFPFFSPLTWMGFRFPTLFKFSYKNPYWDLKPWIRTLPGLSHKV